MSNVVKLRMNWEITVFLPKIKNIKYNFENHMAFSFNMAANFIIFYKK